MTRLRLGSLFIVGAVALAAVPGCSSSSPDPVAAPAAATFTAIYPLLFPVGTNARCNFCHGLPSNDRSNGKLSMGVDKATAYAALVGQTSTSSKCSGKAIVVPSKPDASLFFLKLNASPPCGDHMPLGGNALSSAQLEMVRSWIAAGAKDD